MNNLQSQLEYHNKTYSLQRYPKTADKALRAWSNAEILAINYLTEENADNSELTNNTEMYLYNDRFGVWNCLLTEMMNTHNVDVHTVLSYASQQKAIKQNLALNQLAELDSSSLLSPLDKITPAKQTDKIIVLVKVPKSLDLFDLYLQQIHQLATTSNLKVKVICSFMTKYFTNASIEIAERYFADVNQSKAWKKARLLMLSTPLEKENLAAKAYSPLLSKITFNDSSYQQYKGVFSADKIDIGTQFLLEQFTNGNLQIKKSELNILDLACGNGVIAGELAKQAHADAKFTLVDDFVLATESAKLNTDELTANCICDDNLATLADQSMDLVVSNPPFHFEYENNSEVSIQLFDDVYRVLKAGKRFILIANKHLDYKLHLEQQFTKVFVVATNRKFAVYECVR